MREVREEPATTTLLRRRSTRVIAVPSSPRSPSLGPVGGSRFAAPAAAPSAPLAPPPVQENAATREATVLDAVRALVRPTASEVARYSNVPTTTVYVVLRALVASGRVACTDTIRGIEYSLVSTGHIQPFLP